VKLHDVVGVAVAAVGPDLDAVADPAIVRATLENHPGSVGVSARTGEGIDKLKELWNADVPPETISHTLGRPEAEVRAKAAELRLPQHVAVRAGR